MVCRMEKCIISIDVGIKNIGVCVLTSKEKLIRYWNIINIEPDTIPDKLCNECVSKARYMTLDCYYCKKHANSKCNKGDYYYPLKNEKLNKIMCYHNKDIDNYGIKHNMVYKTNNRDDKIEEIEEHMKKYCMRGVESVKNKYSLIDYGMEIKKKFTSLIEGLDGIEIVSVVIENQLGNIATNMKSLQAMITQYFICNGYNNICYMSSVRKLQYIKKVHKVTYKDRKAIGILYCKELLVNQNELDWIDYMESNKKKDDLCDAYLQGYVYLINKEIKE